MTSAMRKACLSDARPGGINLLRKKANCCGGELLLFLLGEEAIADEIADYVGKNRGGAAAPPPFPLPPGANSILDVINL